MPTPSHPHSRHPRRRTAVALAALTTLLPPLVSHAVPVSWSPDADGQWSTPANWSTSSLPTSADDVTLDRPLGSYTITLSTGSQSVRSLTSSENLSLTGGTLSLSSPSAVSGSFSIGSTTGATLSGAGSLTLAGPATLATGGSLTGAGALSLTNTAVLTLLTTGLSTAGANDTRDIYNAGSINLTSGAHLGANAIIPTLHNLPGGTINKTGTGSAVLGASIDNNGSVNVHQGMLTLGLSNSGTGTFNVDAGATFSLRGTLAAGSAVTGQGTLNIDHAATVLNGSYSLPTTNLVTTTSTGSISATFNAPISTTSLTLAGNSSYGVDATFNAPATLGTLSLSSPSAFTPNTTATFNTAPAALTSLNVSGGTLAGAANLTPTGTSTWSGGTLSGTGHLVIPASGSLSLAPADTLQFLARPLDNSGAISDLAAPANSMLSLQSASLNNLATGHIVLQNVSLWPFGAGASTFNNAGTLTKSGATAISVNVPLTNTGTLTVTAGTLRVQTLSNTGTLSLSSGATLSLSSGATLSLAAGTLSQLTGTTLSAGNWSLSANSTLTLPASASITTLGPSASVTLSGANSSFPALNSLTTNNGSFTLSAGRNFTTAGSLTNAGTLAVLSPSSLTVTGSLLNTGSLTLTGTILLGTAPLIWNYSGPSPLDTVRQYLQSAKLQSSSTDTTHRLAYSETFSGEPPAPTSSLTVQLALTGDANLDGRIDPDDYALLDRAYAKSPPNAHWTDGDFNYSGSVTSADYLLIDKTLALQAGSLSPEFLSQRESQFGSAYVSQLLATVPEPATTFLPTVPLAATSLRRRRNRATSAAT